MTAIEVYSSGALRPILGDLVPRFEQVSRSIVSIRYGRSGMVTAGLLEGEVADVAITTQAGIDDLARHRKVVPDSIAVVACSRIGVAVRAGAAKPELASVAAFKNALMNAQSIAYADPATGSPSGNHFVRVLEQLGIAARLGPRLRLIGAGENGVVVVCETVAAGEAEIGIQQIAEILAVPGVDLVGALPSELQQTTVFSAAVGSRARDLGLARRFIAFITSDASRAVVIAKGMEPAPDQGARPRDRD